MAKTDTMTGDIFRQEIFGPHKDYVRKFYYQGSPDVRAQRIQYQDNPNIEPVPFIIPSAYYSDTFTLAQVQRMPGMTDEEWINSKIAPNYIIEGYVNLGGSINSNTSTIEWKEFPTGIVINSCTFTDQFNIQYLNTKSYVKFHGCTFNNDVRLLNIKAKEVSFSNCSFTSKTLNISNCNIEKLTLNSCNNIIINIENNKRPSLLYPPSVITNDIDHQLPYLNFTDIANCAKITILGKSIGKIMLKNIVCEDVEFDVKVDGIQVINETLGDVKPMPFSIKKFKVEVDEKATSFISLLENLHIHEFTLTGTLKDSTLIATALSIDKIQIQDFINEGKLRLNDVSLTLEGEGELIRSQLGKADFNYVDFSQAGSFRIYLSNITEIIINNTQFPGNIIGKDKDDLRGRREIYRQLKNAAAKQGDRINELLYEKFEMIAFENILTGTNNWNDRIIFWTNKYSNDFGQNWTITVSILLIVCLYLFCGIRLVLVSMRFDHLPTFRHLAQFINFTFNPLHKFSEIFTSYPNINSMQLGFAETLDAISRIFSGYMLFQFLRAFRKYSR